MNENPNTTPHTEKSEHLLNRRHFFSRSGAAILSTAFLSSCSVIDDIFPKKEETIKPDDRDKTLAFFGDSLSIGAGGTAPYGDAVAAALADRPVFVDGIVGQIASRIAVRQGGTPLTITVEGNKLNGIRPVKITDLSSLFLSTPSNDFEYSRTGSVSGVRCTIRRTANLEQGEIYTITPATVSVIEIPVDSLFVLDDVNRLKTATQILWYGRNNIGKPGAEEEIISSLDASIAYITSPARYVVLGVLLASQESKGTENYNDVISINEKLEAKYGKSFLAMTPPTNAEMSAVNYSPTSDDLTDLENLNFPRGLRADFANDDIHLNDKGYQIIANRVVEKLKELKY